MPISREIPVSTNQNLRNGDGCINRDMYTLKVRVRVGVEVEVGVDVVNVWGCRNRV